MEFNSGFKGLIVSWTIYRADDNYSCRLVCLFTRHVTRKHRSCYQ